MGNHWKPLLSGQVAADCRDAVLEIGDRLFDEGPDVLTQIARDRKPSFAGGQAGQALFYAYLGDLLGDSSMTLKARLLLDQATEFVGREAVSVGLFSGFTGVAWTIEHLRQTLGGQADGVDEALHDYISPSPWEGAWDLTRGLAGYGIYALEALPRPGARSLLERAIQRLHELAVRESSGLAWFTPPPLVPEHRRGQYPNGYFDLGVAHGTPGVLSVLGGAVREGVMADRAQEMLEGAVSWLLSHRSDNGSNEFPSLLAKESREPFGNRTGWCYGPPGVAAAIFAAGKTLDREDWQLEAIAIATRTVERERESLVRDAGICHGAAGVGHLYNRLYQASGNDILAEAASAWFRRALQLRQPGLRVAGFAALEPKPDGSGEVFWREDAGLLSGAAGVGLSFIAALSDQEPRWDRALAIAI